MILRFCSGFDTVKIEKTQLIYSASYLNLGGAWSIVLGGLDHKPSVATGLASPRPTLHG